MKRKLGIMMNNMRIKLQIKSIERGIARLERAYERSHLENKNFS